MGRSRYKICEVDKPHFITLTILHWIPIFTRQETVQVVINSFKYLQQNDNLKIFAYIILENHLHAIVKSNDLSETVKRFKSYTAKEIIKFLKQNRIKTILDQLAFYKKTHKTATSYQLWQEGMHAKLIKSDRIMKEVVEYIHNNPVKRGYVDKPEHWRYSSARDYKGILGHLDIEKVW